MLKIMAAMLVLVAVGCADEVDHTWSKCDSSWQEKPGAPRPDECESACETFSAPSGPSCSRSSCVENETPGGANYCDPDMVRGCESTVVVDGHVGCCARANPSVNRIMFFECD